MQEDEAEIEFSENRQMSLAQGQGRELESRFQFGENNGDEEQKQFEAHIAGRAKRSKS